MELETQTLYFLMPWTTWPLACAHLLLLTDLCAPPRWLPSVFTIQVQVHFHPQPLVLSGELIPQMVDSGFLLSAHNHFLREASLVFLTSSSHRSVSSRPLCPSDNIQAHLLDSCCLSVSPPRTESRCLRCLVQVSLEHARQVLAAEDNESGLV